MTHAQAEVGSNAGGDVCGWGAHGALAVDVELRLCGFRVSIELARELAAPHAVGKADDGGAAIDAVPRALEAEGAHLAAKLALYAVQRLLQLGDVIRIVLAPARAARRSAFC